MPVAERRALLAEELSVLGKPVELAEVDDMAVLRLLARDTGSLAMVPEVVVQDELRERVLAKYCEVPGIFENFYAITAKRHFQSAVLKSVLDAWTPPAVGEET